MDAWINKWIDRGMNGGGGMRRSKKEGGEGWEIKYREMQLKLRVS